MLNLETENSKITKILIVIYYFLHAFPYVQQDNHNNPMVGNILFFIEEKVLKNLQYLPKVKYLIGAFLMSNLRKSATP